MSIMNKKQLEENISHEAHELSVKALEELLEFVNFLKFKDQYNKPTEDWKENFISISKWDIEENDIAMTSWKIEQF